MGDSLTSEVLERAEGLLIANEFEEAKRLLAMGAADAEEYVDRNCPTTDELQWFCFPTPFEELAYRRIEGDPRELRCISERFDLLYADLAYAQLRDGDQHGAIESLKQALRWNPMECGYRLDLAELFRSVGDSEEYLALTYSVFARASNADHLARAFLNFATFFAQTNQTRAQAACLRCARRISPENTSVKSALELASHEASPDSLSEDEATQVLAEEGLPEGANADVVVCLLMCATDAAKQGDRLLATQLTVRAYNLVGAACAESLIGLIRESDAERARADVVQNAKRVRADVVQNAKRVRAEKENADVRKT